MNRLVYLFLLGLLSVATGYAQSTGSGVFGNVGVHPGGHIGVYNTLTAVTGYVVTPRSEPTANISWQPGASHSGVSDVSHTNGYAETTGNTAFTFPIGDGTHYRPAGISAPSSGTFSAAYFSSNASSATLPTGAPFSTTSLGSGVRGVSPVEYWDINGPSAVNLTLSWDVTSDLNTMAGGNASSLAIVGWDGSKWVSLGGTATGTLSRTGTITTSTPVTPNTYTAYTFGTVGGCAVPTVGGMVAYLGQLPVCTSSNVGSLTLTGNTGTVVKWQTSTDGGVNWTDIAGTAGKSTVNFVNAQNAQQYRAVVNNGTGCADANASAVTITTSSTACQSAICDNQTGSFSINIVSQATGSNFTAEVVAVDLSGIIRAVSAPGSSNLTGVVPGDYQVYHVTWDNTQAAPTLTVGTAVSAVGGSCVRWSNALAYKVCPLLVLVATPDIANTNPATPVSGNVLTNDQNPSGLPLTASLTTPPAAGTATINPDGSYTYTPPTGFTGTTSFCYAASNTAGQSSSACVTVNVAPAPSLLANNRPIANNDNTQTTAGSPVVIAVLANDTDPDSSTSPNGQFNNPTLLGQPSAGTAVINSNGTLTYTPPTGFTGVVSFPYQVCDKASPSLCTTAVVSVNVLPAVPAGTIQSPVAVDDALLTTRNTPTTATVAANDLDPNSPAQSLSYVSGQPQHGTVVMQPNGTYSYTPAANYAGPDSFTYSVCNASGKCSPATVSVLVQQSGNQAPIGNPDFVDVIPGIPATGNVLTNDHDPEGQPLTASVLGTPPPGLILSPDGSYIYTAPVGTTAPVTVPVQVCDNSTPPACVTTTLTLVPVLPQQPGNNAPVANPDAPHTTAGVPVVVAVLANDADPDGNPLSNPTIVSGPTHGTAVVNADGTVSYTPAPGYSGPDQLVYRVCDSGTLPQCATAAVTISVDPTPPAGVTNTAPIAMDDAALTPTNTPIRATVAANDRDPEGQPLVYSLLSNPAHGTLVLSPTGSYTYTPTAGYVGSDAFVYQVCDNASPTLCATATAHMTVLAPAAQPPVATPDIANTNLGTPVSGNVLTNDQNPSGLPLTASLTTPPAAGTATINPDGSYTYTSPTGFIGTTSFCYTASNTAGQSSSACVTVNVAPAPSLLANNRPIANNDNTQTTSGSPVVIAVLANDTDPDSSTSPNGQFNNPTLLGQPSAGTAVINSNGTVSYTPPANFTGVVSFPYQVCDKASPALCTTAVVSVNVLPAVPAGTIQSPVAVDDALLTTRNTPTTAIVAANDLDPNSPTQSLSYVSGQPQHGTVVMQPNGTYSYTPTANYAGPDSFTYSVCNASGKCSPATVSVLVQQPANQLPVGNPDFVDVIPGIPATGNVLTNDYDPDGQPLTASVIGTPPPGLILTPDGSYTYTAPVGTTAPVTVPIQTCDNSTPPACVTTTLTLVPVLPQQPGNNAPVANPDAPHTTAGVPVVVAVLANDVDPDGNPLNNPTIVSGPTHGTAVVNADGTVSYTPAPGYSGPDQLVYRVCDSGTPPQCATAVVAITVDPTPPAGVTNTAPVAMDDAALTPTNTPIRATVAANDRDPEGQPLVYSSLSNPAHGTLVLSPTGSYTYTPAAGYVGSDAFVYQVCDNASPTLCATATAHMTVIAPAPSLTVVQPTIPGPPTQAVSGTATPGSVVTITDPAGHTLCQTTAGVSGTFSCPVSLTAGVNNLTVTACNASGCISQPMTFTVGTGIVSLNVRVLLQGALLNVNSGSLMRDDLRSGGYLPTTSPYSATANARFAQTGGGGGETTTPAVLSANAGTTNAIVDWVLVELRSAANPATILATRSGLVQRDGDVVLPSDGTSPLSFTGLSGSQYFVSVKHRNHLGVMTATAIPLSTTGTLVDFTTMTDAQVYDKPGTVGYDGVEMITINGKKALWAGDANTDGKVKYIGTSADNTQILNDVITFQGAISNPAYNYDFAFGYFFGDVDLNGKAKYQGSVNDPTVIFNNVVAIYPLNTSQLYNYDFFQEQLP